VSAHEHHHRAGPSRDGTVVLDIGGDVGALVVYTPEQLAAMEVDIMRAGETHPAMHTAVRLREVPGRRTYAAVYPAVPAGDYVLPAIGSLPSLDVTVTGGRVTEVDWRDAPVSATRARRA
jgi:hypothetical protein